MAILARVLMLLAWGPLLQPPGLCACQVVARNAAPEPGHTPEKHGCCAHRVCDAEPTSPAPEQHPSPDPDDSHLPGCPASPGVDRFKWTEPTAQLSLALLPSVGVVTVLPADVAPAHAPVATSAQYRASPPLYLSHCALVI